MENSQDQMEGSAFYYRKRMQIQAPQNNFGKNLKLNKTSSLSQTKSTRYESINPQSRKRILSVLQGKAATVWIFVIDSYISEQLQKRIETIYNGFGNISRQYIVPLYQKCSQIQSFLDLPRSHLKIVSDVKNIKSVIQLGKSEKIHQIYIYNEKGQDGFSTALDAKQKCSKIKGIFMDLQEIVQRAEDDVDNDLRFFQTKNKQIKTRKRVKIFPNFILLSGSDKTKATLYRGNLYGARNLLDCDRKTKFQQFLQLIEEKYKDDEHEHGNIAQYVQLNACHTKQIKTLSQASQILNFYTRQTFYYRIVNSMLRTLKNPKQFNSCILPFNETYQSIKLFYKQNLHKNKRKIPRMTLYRGAKLNISDLNKLRPGAFIQMYGFMSTSSDKQVALSFTDASGIVFKINVPEMVVEKKYDNYDHGFVDINEYNICGENFKYEKEILFNALNVYKVISKKNQSGITIIEIQYGAIFKLLEKKSSLNRQEKQVFTNYQYCTEMLSNIQDQGDAFVLHNELNEAQQYYKQKNQNNEHLYKLANVQHLKGNLKQANQNAQKSLLKELQNFDKEDKEKCMKVCSVHTKVAKIKLDKEDFLTAEDHITEAVNLLPDEPTFEKAIKYRERGQIRFKKGDVVNAEKDFAKSQRILDDLVEYTEDKSFRIKWQYLVNFLTLMFRDKTKQQLDKWYDSQAEDVKNSKSQIEYIKQQITKEHMKVNEALRKVANYVQNKNKYETYVKKGKKYLLQLQSRQTDDPNEKAKIKVMQATIEGCLNLVQSETLLKQAIDLIQKKEPFNENVGKYSQILAELQHKSLSQFNHPQGAQKGSLESGQKIKYNEQEQNQLYKKCKRNYEKAIRIMIYNKGKGSPEVLSLKNKTSQMDFHACNFSESERIIKQAKESMQNRAHTEVAKSQLLLAKIAFSRGQLKSSFERIQQTKNILKEAIVQKDEPKYINVYRNHDLYLESKSLRAKVYIQQLNYDMSLKDIGCVQFYLRKKMEGDEFHSLLPEIYELKAQAYSLNKDKIYEIDEYFESALSLREKQHGKWNIPNASTYCNFAKYLLLLQDLDTAEDNMKKAFQIYSCFDSQHPATYKILFTNALFKIKQEKRQEGLQDLRKCLSLIEKRYDSSHMILAKTKYQYAKQLCNSGYLKQGIEEMLLLQNILHTTLQSSNKRSKIENDLDDEKVRLQRLLYQSLRQSYQQNNQSQKEKRCEIELRTLRNSYEFKLWE